MVQNEFREARVREEARSFFRRRWIDVKAGAPLEPGNFG